MSEHKLMCPECKSLDLLDNPKGGKFCWDHPQATPVEVQVEQCNATWEAAMQTHATELAYDGESQAAYDEIVRCGQKLDEAQAVIQMTKQEERTEKLGGFTKSSDTLVQMMAKATEEISSMAQRYNERSMGRHTGIPVRDMTDLVIANAMTEAYIAFNKRLTQHITWLKEVGEYDAES